LALQGTLIAAIGALAAGTIGAHTLRRWGVSIGALELTTGLILFLVALQPVLQQYAPTGSATEPSESAQELKPASALAFSPLAFPTIVTPYGIAVLVMLVTVRAGDPDIVRQIWAVTGLVLVLDLLGMLGADRILRTPFVAPVLGIIGAVMGVLQVALGVQAIAIGLHLLGID
jgi:multiple antibiotic resistance protein